MIDTGCKPRNLSRSWMTSRVISLSSSREIWVHSQILSNSKMVGIAYISRQMEE